jgi:hypothetical protein
MAITFKSSGAGVSTQTSGAALSPANPATVDAGDILLLFTAWENTTIAPSPAAGDEWVLLSGPLTTSGSVSRVWLYGKIAIGTEDGATNALGSPASADQRAARIFSFAGRTAGGIGQLITGITSNTGATDPTGPTVVTTKAGALACAMVFQNDNNTLETFAGASDTWTERGTVGGFIYALTPGGVLDLLTATPAADPGTVSGGAMTVTDDPWTVIGFQILDSPMALTDSCAVVVDPETATVDTGEVPLTPKSATESLSLTATESATLLQMWAVADSGAIQGSESTTVSIEGEVVKAAVDSCAIQVTEFGYKLQEGIPLIIGTDTAAITQVGKYADDSCAIQAAEASTPSAQIPPTDSCAVQAAESAIIQATVFGADTCVIQVDEAASIASAVVASDSCAVVCAESVSIVSTVSAADSCVVQLSETASVVTVFEEVLKSVSDSLTVQASEAASIVVTLTVTDSCAVQLTDSLSASASESQGDSCAVQCSEAAAVTVVVAATDACAVILEEVGSQQLAGDSLTISVSDSAAVQADESTSIASAVSASDSVTVGLTDTVHVAVFVSVSDSAAVVLTEVASLADEMVAITAADACAIQASEVATTTATLTVAESCAVQVSEVAATTVTVGMADSVMAQLVEDLLASVSASAVDTLPSGLSDAMRIDGTSTYTDSCAVIADEDTIFAGEIIPEFAFSVTESLTVELDELVAALGVPAEEVAMQLIESVTLVQTEVQGFWGGGWIGEHVLIPYGDGQLLNKPRDLPRGDLTW